MEKQQTSGWGDAVVECLAADLRAEFPNQRGLSADNLWRMRQFFAEYSAPEFLEQAVPEMKKLRCKSMEQAVPETASADTAGRQSPTRHARTDCSGFRSERGEPRTACATIHVGYVNHHDKSYDWAERRKLEMHPKTGAAQWVEIRETVKEVVVPVYVPLETPAPSKPRLFADKSDEELLGDGVPIEWLNDVRQATEDGLLLLADRLPGEAAEALLELATGVKPRMAQPATPVTNPFEHPDAQRRFRVMTNIEELQCALDFPWEKWTVFLHPEQRQWVERD